jgi:hypothetical protein
MSRCHRDLGERLPWRMQPLRLAVASGRPSAQHLSLRSAARIESAGDLQKEASDYGRRQV